MRLREYGPTAWLAELDTATDDEVGPATWAAAALAAAGGDVEDVVPGARTVLISLRPGADRMAIMARLRSVRPPPDTERAAAAALAIEVTYDGPDLDDVAAATALTVDEVVARHTAVTYRCAFCGFAPGFAYLTGLDPALHLPRRGTPRTRVPAGSVAVAADCSAVYPSASPGGWHLLGRTDVVLWDPARDPPALIRPGTAVRFVPR